MRGAALERLGDELQGYDASNTVIRFTPDKPLPTSLVEKIVKLRIEEIDAREETSMEKKVMSADGTEIALKNRGEVPR